MPLKKDHIEERSVGRDKKRSLIKAISRKAFWSYPEISPSKVPDSKLIEKVLIYGSDKERGDLLDLFPVEKFKRVWERRFDHTGTEAPQTKPQVGSVFFSDRGS